MCTTEFFSNYQVIKASLQAKGHQFRSQTDTEVFANLLQEEYSICQDVETAFCNALNKLEGSYAIAMLSVFQPDTIFAVKKDSPLVLGINDGVNFVSSDMNAFISETRDTVLINDYEYVTMTNDAFQVKSLSDNLTISKQIIHVQWDRETAQRGGFSHYMLKEIFDQPQTVRQTLHISAQEIETIAKKFIDKPQSFCVGVGTTYYVADRKSVV